MVDRRTIVTGLGALATSVASMAAETWGNRTSTDHGATLVTDGLDCSVPSESDVGKLRAGGVDCMTKPLFGVIYAGDYAIDPTGVTDSAPGLNLAIQDAITQKKKLVLPSGVFRLDAPLLCYQGSFSTFTMEGAGGPAWPSSSASPQYTPNTYTANTVLFANFNNLPALIFNANRNCVIRDFAIMGVNIAPLPASNATSDVQANYITAGCRTDRYSPYCGIAVDPFNVNTPPDTGQGPGYPGMTYPQNLGQGTSGLFIERVSISWFVVGIAVATSGVGENGDSIQLMKCQLQFHDTCLAIGGGQCRAIDVEDGSMIKARQAIDCLNYGAQQGIPPSMRRVNFGAGMYRIFAMSSQFGEAVFDACYAENFLTLGQFGTGASTSRTPLTFLGGQYSVGIAAIPNPPYALETYGPTTFIGVNLFSAITGVQEAWNFIAACGVSIKGCALSGSATSGLLPHIGLDWSGLSTGAARVEDSYVIGPVGINLSDNAARMGGVSSFNIPGHAGRLAATWQTHRVTNGNLEYDFLPGIAAPSIQIANCSTFVLGTTAYTITGISQAGRAVVTVSTSTDTNPFVVGQNVTFASVVGMTEINGLVGAVTAIGGTSGNWTCTVGINSSAFTAYSSAGTATMPTVTFTCTTPQFLMVGDILAWTMIDQGYSGLSYIVPGLKITSIVSNAITCVYLFDPIEYSATPPLATAVLLFPYHWAPTVALTGTTATDATLTSVSTTTILMNGDFVKGTNIPANTRVVSGAGTASLVLNQATTGNGSTALYFGRLYAPTLTAAF
jgi:hypothetical protein